MKIWRIEDGEGNGCYRSSDTITILNRHYKSKGHPEPHQDVEIERKIRKDEICGFLNKKQAMKWFNEIELHYLREAGYNLKQVEVKKITAIGRTQVLAIR